MIQGSFQHEDFCGHKGTIHAGDLQVKNGSARVWLHETKELCFYCHNLTLLCDGDEGYLFLFLYL